MKKPNILFFFTDDQRYDTIRALGNGQIHTPNFDRLVAEGTAFIRAHIPGGTCCAVCMPSRAMLHTGRTLFHIQGEGQEIPPEHVTMGECFQAAGYETFGTGKWHNGRSAYARSFSSGDQIFFGGMADHWNVPVYRFDPSGKYAQRCPVVTDPFHSNAVEYRECDHIHAGMHSTDMLAESAIRFLEERDAASEKPFFMYVSLLAPHDPRTMPERFRKMYKPEDIELPANFLTEHPVDNGALDVRDELLAALPRDPEEIRRHIAEYYGMISHLDDALGQIMDALRRKGELENTIIVTAGDNGLAIGQHGLMGKQNLYECSVRVPLIFSGPGIPKGQQSDALVYLLDIFPTLCELADVEAPLTVDGSSLCSCMTKSAFGREFLYLAFRDSQRGVTNGKFKLIEYTCGHTQLFDLQADPAEMNNLAEQKNFSSILAALRVRLCRLAKEWDDRKHPKGQTFWKKRKDLCQTTTGRE